MPDARHKKRPEREARWSRAALVVSVMRLAWDVLRAFGVAGP